MTTTRRLDPLAILGGMVLEDGRRWGEAAYPWQRADVAAVLGPAPGAPRRHFTLRGRGMSKTTDVAALTLALLLTEAPPRARCHVYAADADQAAVFADALAGLVTRTPGLAGAVELGARTVTVRASGASLAVEASDGASAFGLRPWLTVVDELGAWPATTNHRRLWSAIVSAVPKVPGARLLVIGTAGSPSGLGAEVWAEAEKSPHWRTSRTPGPSPWWTTEDVEATRDSLTPSEWRRLILCEWAEGDDSLTTPEDVAACVRAGSATLAPQRGHDYVAALDVGTRRDLTALAVGHRERTEAGRVVVIDRVLYWRPEAGEGGRVDLAEVEAAALRLCREYHARLRFDRMQAEQLTANLARAGVSVTEFVFSTAGTNRLARALWGALRDRSLSLPDETETRAEFVATRLVETGPGTVKLANPPGAHDDIVTAVGMVVADLAERPDVAGTGRISNPSRLRPGPITRTFTGGRPKLPLRVALRQAAGEMPPGMPGGGAIVLPGGPRQELRSMLSSSPNTSRTMRSRNHGNSP
ncbi:hypothetical protein [Micropruina sp.]|uniref:hypothetical protein n=1 Tax=Micropruina sp. TaxID=2737536 RepID=UPI0039E3B8B9